MPLLSATAAEADHICVVCGTERHLTMTDWFTEDTDASVFTTPPCGVCTSTESFSWHDWVYMDNDGRPDHTRIGARQMVLIGRVASALGRQKRTIPEQAGRRYDQEPTAPVLSEARDLWRVVGEG